MRTRTKIKIAVTIWTLTMATIIIIADAINERANTDRILAVLIGGDMVDWIAHVAGVVKENVATVGRKEV